MTTVATPSRPRKPKKAPERKLSFDPRQGLLTLVIDGREFYYWCERWAHVAAPVHAFRLTKLRTPGVEPEAYDATFNSATSEKTCDCKGHLRHGHCKHADAVAVLVNRGSI